MKTCLKLLLVSFALAGTASAACKGLSDTPKGAAPASSSSSAPARDGDNTIVAPAKTSPVTPVTPKGKPRSPHQTWGRYWLT